MRSRALLVAFAAMLCLTACSDERDAGRDDPGEAHGPTKAGNSSVATVRTSVVMLPLAARVADAVDRPAGISVDVKATNSDDALARLCAAKADVALANRRMKEAERNTCRRNGLRPVRSVVAYQAVVLYRGQRLRLRCLTLAQLRRLWRTGSTVRNYGDLGGDLPEQAVRLIAPPVEDAAARFFRRQVLRGGPLRKDARRVVEPLSFTDVIANSPRALALGPFNLARPAEVRSRIAVDAGHGCVIPTSKTIRSRTYPLSAPLFMYTTQRSVESSSVRRFVDFALEHPRRAAAYPGVVPAAPSAVPEAEPDA